MSLIRLHLPPILGAMNHAVQKATLRALYHGLAFGDRGGRPVNGTSHLGPGQPQAPRAYTLSLDLEPRLEGASEPLDALTRPYGCEIIAMEERPQIA